MRKRSESEVLIGTYTVGLDQINPTPNCDVMLPEFRRDLLKCNKAAKLVRMGATSASSVQDT